MASKVIGFFSHRVTIAICLVTCFLIYGWLSFHSGVIYDEASGTYPIFNQPDEVANAAFIRSLVIDHKVKINSPLSALSFDQVHPRSMTVTNGQFVPIGFPAFIVVIALLTSILFFLFGWLLSFSTLAAFWVPAIGVFSSVLVFKLLRQFFSKKESFLGAALFLALPPWWYYSSRVMQHNTLFIAALLLTLFLFLKYSQKEVHLRTKWLAYMVGVVAGSAVALRPVESIWVGGFLLGLYWWRRKNLRGFFSPAFLGMLSVAFIFFLIQFSYYGHPLGTGYAIPEAGQAGTLLDGNVQGRSFLQAVLFPFGFHPNAIVKTLYAYSVRLFPVWTMVAFLGFLFSFFLKEQKTKQFFLVYRIFFVGIAAYLLVYYGSWSFTDNLAGAISIGSSQVRYFLPIYVGAIPFVLLLFSALCSRRKHVYTLIGMFLFSILMLQSYLHVYASFEGVYHIQHTTQEYAVWNDRLQQQLPQDAIVVTRYADKYIYPTRDVIAGFTDPIVFDAVGQLVDAGYSVYYFDISSDQTYLTSVKETLFEDMLILSEPLDQWSDLELREITRNK